MKNRGKWIGSTVMLANSFAWLLLGRLFIGQPVWMFCFIFLNGLIGFGLGLCFDRVKATSVRDDLTQAYNRRFLHQIIPALFTKTRRSKGYLSFTLIDCDDFKKINDQHGHEVGDLVLQNISRMLIENTRSDDYVIRWGGDEFIIITNNADPASIRSIGERLEGQLKVLSSRMNLPLSVSVGTAVYPLEASHFEELLRIADHKMYQYKFLKKEAALC